MIVELQVENLAIIQSAQLPFFKGFTVLTGETGAGKSLMIDALELALGERADVELVRTGAHKASVRLTLGNLEAHEKMLEAFGLELEEGLLHIHREVLAEGRSTARVNGKMMPVSVLRTLGARLVDLHGQHKHQALFDPATHIDFLDAVIGDEIQGPKQTVQSAHARFIELAHRVAKMKQGARDREQRLDLLKFQISEIDEVGLQRGEIAEVTAAISRLKHLERLQSASAEVLSLLDESDPNAVDRARSAAKVLADAARLDESLASALETLQVAVVQLEEAAHQIRSYADTLENMPGALDLAIERLDAIKRLQRKYGVDETEILDYRARAEAELTELQAMEMSDEEAEIALSEARAKLTSACTALTQLRQKHAPQFAKLAADQLHDLAMPKAQLQVRLVPTAPSENGADEVEFLFSANAGEELKPLAKIASGGEVSRLMLALKTVLAGKAGVPTLIFDEIDTGLGGKAAATIGRKLRELGQHYQVIAISHLPQVACHADAHFRIEKIEAGGRVHTSVGPLSADERVEELARMLAGDAVTEAALVNAREMLSQSHSKMVL